MLGPIDKLLPIFTDHFYFESSGLKFISTDFTQGIDNLLSNS